MTLDRSEVYDLLHGKGWRHIADVGHTDTYRFNLGVAGQEDLVRHKYLYVNFDSYDELDGDETRLIIPHDAKIFQTDDDDEGDLLAWWAEGNEGDENDWWNQLSKEEQERISG